ncbi:MAG: FAD-binding oxidoreductase [Rhodoferax sp.]|uniref:2Fe-2S iron-sulfur cluster-binding protein n=1 Tax=Rhodoferax sp. TaxID=50421 RepID=UPI002726FD65|nr:2Fe-2S iron-sulfur cluster-binding protein [Rhodoferax sp.]MDO8451200.1 FAD-binding oxidoreductase [Rhodoferax sp.]
MNQPGYSIRLAGTDTCYTVPPGDNLLRAGLRAGIGMPYECNAGGCGSCKFEVVSGEVEDRWPDAPGISAKDRAKGRHLACQCRPLSNCEIKIRVSESFVPVVRPESFEAEYVGSQHVTDDIREFRFRGKQPARFLPGQYALLELPGVGQVRAYSMSNQPNEAGDWNVMVRRVPNGKVSNLLFDALQVGQFVQIDGPYGLANLRPEAPRDVVCIAGGSGLAPMLSVANAAAACAELGGRSISLFYGGRGPADIPQFGDWLSQPHRVQCKAAVSVAELADQGGWTGERGFVHELLVRSLGGDFATREYYLAGPPPMIETVVRALMVDHQVHATQIHYDRFF